MRNKTQTKQRGQEHQAIPPGNAWQCAEAMLLRTILDSNMPDYSTNQGAFASYPLHWWYNLMVQSSNHSQMLKVGERVRFHFVSGDVEGRIIEDRGAIAKGGQRLYRVLFEMDDVSREIELPAENIQPVVVR